MIHLQKYFDYMTSKFPQDPKKQAQKCVVFSKRMAKEFPELSFKWGYVYSNSNPANKYPTQYTHAWLEAPCGTIIDPTVLQFINLDALLYVETIHTEYKCCGCGQFMEHNVRYCGKCGFDESNDY